MFYQTLRKPMEYFYFSGYMAAAVMAGFSARGKDYKDLWTWVTIALLFFALWLDKIQ
jgi:hypothetical protein